MSARSPIVRAMPCICCEKQQCSQPWPTEEHHLLSGGRRRGDEYSIPACQWHHRAKTLPAIPLQTMTRLYGPSLAQGSKLFHERYGSDDELLAETNEKLMAIV